MTTRRLEHLPITILQTIGAIAALPIAAVLLALAALLAPPAAIALIAIAAGILATAAIVAVAVVVAQAVLTPLAAVMVWLYLAAAGALVAAVQAGAAWLHRVGPALRAHADAWSARARKAPAAMHAFVQRHLREPLTAALRRAQAAGDRLGSILHRAMRRTPTLQPVRWPGARRRTRSPNP